MKRLLVAAMVVSTVLSPTFVSGTLKAESKEAAGADDVQKPPVLVGNIDVDVPLNIPMYANKGEKTGLFFTFARGEESYLEIEFGNDSVNGTFDVAGSEVAYEITVNHGGNGMITGYHVTLKGVPANHKYTISLNGKGYASTTKEVDLSGYHKSLSFPNDSVFLVGDVNDDKQVNEEDYQAVLKAIDSDSEVVKYDLNRDKRIDIEDLNIVAQNVGVKPAEAQEQITVAIIDTSGVDSTVTTDSENELTEESKNVDLDALFSDSEKTTTIGFKEPEAIITEDNPITLALELPEVVKMSKVEIVAPESDAGISAGILIVEDSKGRTKEFPFSPSVKSRARDAQKETIQIDLGEQIAVKKITIKVTGTKKESNLVEIAKVEFVNDVYEEIPEKEIDYPKNVKAIAGNGTIDISWDEVLNVHEYEVKYEFTNAKGGKESKTVKTKELNLKLEGLANFTTYKISVQSLSAGWQSGYGEVVTATPFSTTKPSAPENLKAKSEYRAFQLSWSPSKETTSYNLYYRLQGQEEFVKLSNLKTTSYHLENVENGKYEFYVTAVNTIGESEPAKTITAETSDLVPTEPYKYKLINSSNGFDELSEHIEDVTYNYPSVTPNYDKFDIVDNDPGSYWGINGMDGGGHSGSDIGPIVVFDKEYTMKEVVIVPAYNQKYSFTAAQIYAWDSNGIKITDIKTTLSQRKDGNGNTYYVAIFNKPITTKKIEVNVGYTQASSDKSDTIRISEMMFYEYSSIEKDIDSLFIDDYHLTLHSDVDEKMLDKLTADLEVKDPKSGEKHPRYENLLKDIKYARELLVDQPELSELFTVDRKVNGAGDNELRFEMSLSDYQPLGLSAKAGEEISIYVGAESGIADYGVELVVTQYQGSPYAWKQVIPLNKGKNVISIPSIIQTKEETGGSLYIRYTKAAPTGADSIKQVKLRIVGGTKIPFLNLSQVSEENKKAAVATYVADLKTYVDDTLPDIYGSSFDSNTSVLNTTEIMNDKTLLSLPADAVYNVLKGKTEKEQIDILLENDKALNQMMQMSYNLEGLSDSSSASKKNKIPKTRANFRYATMIPGAGMYATSYHMGFTYGSTGGLVTGTPSKEQSDGSYAGGKLYGWGVVHELGHVLDQRDVNRQEISNNLFPLFAQKLEGKAETRVAEREEQVYAKVTSGAVGGFDANTGLAMYWQLHLAYDTEPVTPTNVSAFYKKYFTQLRNSTTTGVNRDDLMIRTASDAAGKDLSDFFTKWGFVVSDQTKEYLKKYEKETRNIEYINDAASNYRVAKKQGMAKDTVVQADLVEDKEDSDYKSVTLNLSTSKDKDAILGYEIKRNGKVVDFVKVDKNAEKTQYIDRLDSMNNRVVSYEVTAYDYLLNETETVTIAPFKIKHDGTIGKKQWTMTSNVDADQVEEGSDKDNTRLDVLKNNDFKDVYKGQTQAKPAIPAYDDIPAQPAKPAEDVTFNIDLNKEQLLSGIKFTAAIEDGNLAENTPTGYKVYTSKNNTDWELVANGTLEFTAQKPTTTIYFSPTGDVSENQLGVFDAHYVKVVFNTKTVELAEIDLFAPPGDNVELIENGIGILKDDYIYDEKNNQKIPKGSLVFNGKYRGNPAFNAIVLLDENEELVVGTNEEAGSIFMAQLPKEGELYEVSDGNWIYWIEPEGLDMDNLPKQVYVKLYRVENATTLEGQRLVSDTLKVTLPDELPIIEFTKGQVK